jgi:hypothetical protein
MEFEANLGHSKGTWVHAHKQDLHFLAPCIANNSDPNSGHKVIVAVRHSEEGGIILTMINSNKSNN